ncbi:Winged helix DNA-binding domain superfamily [Sesbania bispinosa]|nr:Winged helix DNA-binding domain superfamily [Sesbania bispinosa]
MATARDSEGCVSPHEFVKAYSAHLKRSGKMELPEWTDIVKTARLRSWLLMIQIGTMLELRIYGGSKRNGSRPPHFCKSSGAIARHILQQLQNMSIIELDTKGGRRITSSGRRDLDQVAGRICSCTLICKLLRTTSQLHKLLGFGFLERCDDNRFMCNFDLDAELPFFMFWTINAMLLWMIF